MKKLLGNLLQVVASYIALFLYQISKMVDLKCVPMKWRLCAAQLWTNICIFFYKMLFGKR